MSRAEYTFVIDALKPETLSLARLVAYLAELTKVLGDDAGLHFDRVKEGSAQLVAWADEPTQHQITKRFMLIRTGEIPPETSNAIHKLNELLRNDDAVGKLCGTGEIIDFPGRDILRGESIGPIQQHTTVEGQLFRLGGRGKSVNFHLDDGTKVWSGMTTRQLAREMAPYLFGATIRVSGAGVWKRSAEGDWALTSFTATMVEPLDDAPLSEALAQIRAVGGLSDSATELGNWQEIRGMNEAVD